MASDSQNEPQNESEIPDADLFFAAGAGSFDPFIHVRCWSCGNHTLKIAETCPFCGDALFAEADLDSVFTTFTQEWLD